MFWNQNKNKKKATENTVKKTALTINAFRHLLANMEDAEIVEHQTEKGHNFSLLYIRTLIDEERLNESIIGPLIRCSHDRIHECITSSKISKVTTQEEAQNDLMVGSVLAYNHHQNQWWSVQLENPLSRQVEDSKTETLIYGAKDSFTEQLDQNIRLIRRRLPLTALKTEEYTVGTLSKTKIVLMYIEGLTNPEFIALARKKVSQINFDQILDSSQVAAFMEDHIHSLFAQFQKTDRPDASAYALSIGKVVFLVDNSPFSLSAPTSFFDLFQSPEDYFLRWNIASFLRSIRYLSFFLTVVLVPFYVSLIVHHYKMIPLEMLSILLESRRELPFTPFWEALLMLIILEIIKEASLRMPTKTGQILGVVGGIIIGQAAVEAGFASKILIVLVGISAIASFMVPNYGMTKINTLIQFVFLALAALLGIFGIAMGLIVVLIHLNGLTSLKQPYFAPVTPFHPRDWIDLFIRGPLQWMKTRPESLRPLQKWRYNQRR